MSRSFWREPDKATTPACIQTRPPVSQLTEPHNIGHSAIEGGGIQ